MQKLAIALDKPINIPSSISVCPYCGEELSITPLEISEAEDGQITLESFETECGSEPDIEDEEAWELWSQSHSIMPYVYQLPVDETIRKWVNSNLA